MTDQSSFCKQFSPLEFVFDKPSSDLLFLKETEILSVLKGNLVPIQEFLDKATFDSI